jgi:dihydropteroate synthase
VTADDLIVPAADAEKLTEIASWDGFRPARFPDSDFPVDVVRLAGSTSRPIVVCRARRAETLKALPASLRERAAAAFSRASTPPKTMALARGRALDLSEAPLVLGVVNVTPDSFSDGGLYLDRGRAIERALELFAQGAAIVDIGGESTRPGTYGDTAEISEEEEVARVLPVIEGIRKRTADPLSIDTRHAGVARRALEAGADLVNDVSSLRYDAAMAATVAAAGAGVILMHMRGLDPRTMQRDTTYSHLLGEVAGELAAAAAFAVEAGVAPGAIAIDPGLGFGKSPEGNLLLLGHLAAFRTLGYPVAIGASRKGFVRRFSGVADDAPSPDRLSGSLACVAAAADAGAAIVRVHDVLETVRYLRMRRAIREGSRDAAAGGRSASAVTRERAGAVRS